ncbi:hypothetical protein [Aquimarina addita]
MKKNILYVIMLLGLVNFGCLNEKSNDQDIHYYKEILKLKNIDLKEVEVFFVIEEEDSTQNSIRNGIVFCNTDSTHTFSYSIDLQNNSSLKLTENYFDKSHPSYNNRSSLWEIAKLNFQYLYEIEKINPKSKGKLNYNIISFKKGFTQPKEIYLKDVSININSQKK